jgi:hypothetical protein
VEASGKRSKTPEKSRSSKKSKKKGSAELSSPSVDKSMPSTVEELGEELNGMQLDSPLAAFSATALTPQQSVTLHGAYADGAHLPPTGPLFTPSIDTVDLASAMRPVSPEKSEEKADRKDRSKSNKKSSKKHGKEASSRSNKEKSAKRGPHAVATEETIQEDQEPPAEEDTFDPTGSMRFASPSKASRQHPSMLLSQPSHSKVLEQATRDAEANASERKLITRRSFESVLSLSCFFSSCVMAPSQAPVRTARCGHQAARERGHRHQAQRSLCGRSRQDSRDPGEPRGEDHVSRHAALR